MAGQRVTYEDRIIQDPAIMAGKPVVKGTRIPVALVLEYLSRHPSFDELFAAYPRLTRDDVKACFAYAQAMLKGRRKLATASRLSTQPH